MSTEEFLNIIGALAVAPFKGTPLIFVDDNGLTPVGKLWYTILANVPGKLLQTAVLDVIATEEFTPAIATVNKYIRKYIDREEITGDEAWAKVEKERRRVGWGAPDFPDEPDRDILLNAVMSVGGWRSMGLCPEDESGILRAQFRKAYDAAKKRHKVNIEFEGYTLAIMHNFKMLGEQ